MSELPRPEYRQWRLVGLVMLGGAIGAMMRYALVLLLPTPSAFPLPILVANVAGSFILGFITAVVARRGAAKTATTQRARLFFGTGICGGFTTYSTLALDITTLGGLASGETRSLAVMTAYIAATLVLGTLAAVAGMAVGQHHTASASPPGRSS